MIKTLKCEGNKINRVVNLIKLVASKPKIKECLGSQNELDTNAKVNINDSKEANAGELELAQGRAETKAENIADLEVE